MSKRIFAVEDCVPHDGGKSFSDEDSEGRARRAIVRSRTSLGLARAMAERWAPFAESYYDDHR